MNGSAGAGAAVAATGESPFSATPSNPHVQDQVR